MAKTCGSTAWRFERPFKATAWFVALSLNDRVKSLHLVKQPKSAFFLRGFARTSSRQHIFENTPLHLSVIIHAVHSVHGADGEEGDARCLEKHGDEIQRVFL